MDLDRVAPSIEKVSSPLSRIFDSAGQVILAMMALLITTDVVLRYFFNRPIKGSYELVEFMMILLVFLGLAYTQTKKGHISITLFTGKLSPAQLAVIQTATYLLCLCLFSIITWRAVVQAEIFRIANDASGVLLIPKYPFMWVVFIGSGLLTLEFLKDFIHSLDMVFKNCDNPWLWFTLDCLFVFLMFTLPVWFHWLPWDISRPVMGIVGIGLLILLMFSSMPIGPVMALIGFIGFANLIDVEVSLSMLGMSPYHSASLQGLSTIPLFILMGLFCFHAGLSKSVYATMRNWMGRLPGGLAMATVGGCAGFAAVSGASIATAVTMGTIALPEMRRHKYADSLACGCVAAGGSIGILIPPSVPFIIYAMLTELSIGKLFMAGVIPGLMEAAFYILTIYILCRIKPELGPPGPSTTLKEKILSMKDTWGILLIFIIVIGGIYTGAFTPTESAGVGAFAAFLLGVINKKLNGSNIITALAETCRITAMILLALIGANIFNYLLTMSQMDCVDRCYLSYTFSSLIAIVAR